MPDSRPLGLVRDTENAKLNRHLRRFEGYDFAGFSRTIARRERWSPMRTATAEKAIKQFFALAFLDPGHLHTPGVDVDTLWHAMILQTPWYCRFCSRFFHGYYHHFLEADLALCRARRERTEQATEYWFGAAARRALKFSAACGNNGRPDRAAKLADFVPPKHVRFKWFGQ